MPHQKYDEWKLATPWDDEQEEELKCCSDCGDPCTSEELNDDDLCTRCEALAMNIEDSEEF